MYICPANAQDILVIEDGKIIKRSELERFIEMPGAFNIACRIGEYLFLVPDKYPYIVRLDTRNDKVSYIMGVNEIFIREIDGEHRVGGSCTWNQYLPRRTARCWLSTARVWKLRF